MLTLTATSLGFVLVQLDVTIVNVALKRIGGALGGGVVDMQWIVDAYTIAFASLIPSAGALGDRVGAKRVFIGGFTIFTAGSLLCGAAPSLSILIGARALQGIGAASLVPCSLALLNHAYRDDRARARAVGIWAGGASVALAAGPVLGGVLVDTVGWRSIFFINLPIGLVGIWLTWRWARESPLARSRGLDLAGQGAGIVALGALAAAVIEAGRQGPLHPLVLGAAALFVIATGGFLAIEWRSTDPMLPLGLFRRPTFSAATVVGLLTNIAYYGLIFLLSLYLQQIKGYTPLVTGAAFLPMTAIVLTANIASGRLAGRIGPRLPMLTGQLLFAAGCAALVTIAADTHYGGIWWQMLLMGAGIGLTVPAMTAAVLSTVERSRSGIASGVLNATRQVGSVIGVALFGALIADPGRIIAGTHAALYIATVLLVIGAAVSLVYVGGASVSGARREGSDA